MRVKTSGSADGGKLGCYTRQEAESMKSNFLSVAGRTPTQSSVLLNNQEYLSKHDVSYSSITNPPLAFDGLPLGNGRMGGLVRAMPYGIKLLVNRADVVGVNSYTDVPVDDPNDLKPLHRANCCGWMEIDFGERSLPADTFQGLEYYTALGTITGGGLEIKIIACDDTDIMVFQVKDLRDKESRKPVKLRLRMMRDPLLQSGPRPLTAASEIKAIGNDLLLTQTYTEPGIEGIPNSEHYCSSAVMLSVDGIHVSRSAAKPLDQRTIEMSFTAEDEYTIRLATAATLDKSKNTIALAQNAYNKNGGKTFAQLLTEHEAWWSDFWGESYVCLRSDSGKAEYLERGWVGWLYSMACCSRGEFVPHWNVLLWRHDGDWEFVWSGPRMWGWNLQAHYEGILASNHPELMEPYLKSYWRGVENGRWHAKHIRGSKGTYLSEVQFWNGIRTYQNVSEEILTEHRNWLFQRKSWEELSDEFKQYIKKYAGCDETLIGYQTSLRETPAWITSARHGKKIEPYWYHTHCFSTGAKVAWRFFLAWEYTRDLDFLRARAYPLIRDMAEFYRNYPNVKKEADGKYHIYNVHSHEPVWGAQDTMEELCAMKAMATLAYRLAQVLDTDKDLQPLWQDLADNTAPVPTTRHPDAFVPYGNDRHGQHHLRTPYGAGEPERWVQGLEPCFAHGGVDSSTPARHWVFFDLATLETDSPRLRELAMNTLQAEPWYHDLERGAATFSLSEIPTIAMMMGMADKTRDWLPQHFSGIGWSDYTHPDRNNLYVSPTSPGGISMEGIGYSAHHTQLALLQSVAAAPGLDPVIRVFPAWPTEWDAAFKLAARRGFVVSSMMKEGRIRFVELISKRGEACRIRNPWPKGKVSLYLTTGNHQWEKRKSLSGSLLTFNTRPGDLLLMLPGDLTPDGIKNDLDVNNSMNVKSYKEWVPEYPVN
jgi:hypothetical protein